MVNYKLLADDDPGGDLQTAFDSMEAETVTTNPEVMLTYKGIARDVNLNTAGQLALALDSSPVWIDHAMRTDGINVNNLQVAPFLTTLIGGSFTQAMVDSIKSLGNVVSPKYVGLKKGHLANARQMRADGRV